MLASGKLLLAAGLTINIKDSNTPSCKFLGGMTHSFALVRFWQFGWVLTSTRHVFNTITPYFCSRLLLHRLRWFYAKKPCTVLLDEDVSVKRYLFSARSTRTSGKSRSEKKWTTFSSCALHTARLTAFFLFLSSLIYALHTYASDGARFHSFYWAITEKPRFDPFVGRSSRVLDWFPDFCLACGASEIDLSELERENQKL